MNITFRSFYNFFNLSLSDITKILRHDINSIVLESFGLQEHIDIPDNISTSLVSPFEI